MTLDVLWVFYEAHKMWQSWQEVLRKRKARDIAALGAYQQASPVPRVSPKVISVLLKTIYLKTIFSNIPETYSKSQSYSEPGLVFQRRYTLFPLLIWGHDHKFMRPDKPMELLLHPSNCNSQGTLLLYYLSFAHLHTRSPVAVWLTASPFLELVEHTGLSQPWAGGPSLL
jgi:hypothetical protein